MKNTKSFFCRRLRGFRANLLSVSCSEVVPKLPLKNVFDFHGKIECEAAPALRISPVYCSPFEAISREPLVELPRAHALMAEFASQTDQALVLYHGQSRSIAGRQPRIGYEDQHSCAALDKFCQQSGAQEVLASVVLHFPTFDSERLC